MGLALAFLLFSAVPGRASVTAEEAAVSERLSSQANEFLISLVGPGRGKVVVTVQGEQTQSSFQSESDIPTPVEPVAPSKKDELRMLMLPGYTKETAEKEETARKEELAKKEAKGNEPMIMRKSQQSSSLESGLQIKLMRVSVVLDSRLAQEQVDSVTDLLPKFLHLDASRGDAMTVLHADLRLDNWKFVAQSYLLSKEGVDTVAVLIGVLLLILLSSILVHFTTNSAIRTFVLELAAHRAPPSGDALPAARLRNEADSPELLSGGMPSLDVEGEEQPLADAAPVPLLGQRFDFLTSRNPTDLTKLIGSEPPQELALLFATLTASHPDLAASLFSALEPSARAAVSLSLAGMTSADPERLEALENRLKNMVNFGVRGPERLGEILSRLPLNERESLVRDVVSTNPAIAQELERSLFSFEDVFQLKDADFRRLISAMPYADWGLALRGAPKNLVDRILAELDPGPQGMLKEALESPQPRAKILETRSKILSRTLTMAARGEIALQRESTEMI